jgi:NAD(P)-dependent dehydrogenase (short-subunit alcohol dehydrogenase family)
MSDDTIASDLRSKLLGQVALARRATQHLTDGGSITLTAGTFDTPLPGSSIGALVNAGLQGFVRSAAVELNRGLRMNAVSPGWIRETLQAMGEDGAQATPVSDVAAAYRDLIEGTAQGTTIVPVPSCDQSPFGILIRRRGRGRWRRLMRCRRVRWRFRGFSR